MSVTGMPLLEDELLVGVVTQFPYDGRRYPMLDFFPRESAATDKITWDIVVGERGMAELTHIDAEGHQIARDKVKQGTAEPMYMREFHRLLDSEMSLLREPGAGGAPGTAGNPEKAERARNRMLGKLVARQNARRNWACARVLSAGALTYSKKGLILSVNYSFPTLTAPGTAWNAGAAHTPIKNVRGWITEYSETAGYAPDAVFYNPKVLEKIEAATEWKDLVKASPMLAQQIIEGSTQPMVIGTLPLVWIPITGQHVNDSGSLEDIWPENTLTFANLQIEEELPFGNWMALENKENNYTGQPAAWSWEGDGTARGKVYVAASDNGLPVVYNQNRVQRVTLWS